MVKVFFRIFLSCLVIMPIHAIAQDVALEREAKEGSRLERDQGQNSWLGCLANYVPNQATLAEVIPVVTMASLAAWVQNLLLKAFPVPEVQHKGLKESKYNLPGISEAELENLFGQFWPGRQIVPIGETVTLLNSPAATSEVQEELATQKVDNDTETINNLRRESKLRAMRILHHAATVKGYICPLVTSIEALVNPILEVLEKNTDLTIAVDGWALLVAIESTLKNVSVEADLYRKIPTISDEGPTPAEAKAHDNALSAWRHAVGKRLIQVKRDAQMLNRKFSESPSSSNQNSPRFKLNKLKEYFIRLATISKAF
ncbi:MAG TPA: hypothetical protein VHA52_06465 [Candidatus Babeliaceae bacterium]|nr:hypothetical protein [Candidatus Babeliaceae bacterium]